MRIEFLSSENIFRVKSNDRCIYISNKTRSLLYQNGFEETADLIGKDYLLQHIAFNNGDTIIDCGANVGDLLLFFKKNSINIDYIGFEPSPMEFKCLQRNISGGNLKNMGLWSSDGFEYFYVSSEQADSSLIMPKKYSSKIKVKTVKLDNIINKNIKLLKLEAEGAEPEILQGAINSLNKIEYISADLGFERGKNSESTLVPVINFLMGNNFNLVEINHERVVALFKNRRYE